MVARVRIILAWILITAACGVFALRDLWLYGNFVGGHWTEQKLWGEDILELDVCKLCGLVITGNPSQPSCRQFILHWS
jgi:hypothetical protein